MRYTNTKVNLYATALKPVLLGYKLVILGLQLYALVQECNYYLRDV